MVSLSPDPLPLTPLPGTLLRPGVGVQGISVSQFVERYRHGASWEYDHPLEQRALERGYGIIVWQEQVVSSSWTWRGSRLPRPMR